MMHFHASLIYLYRMASIYLFIFILLGPNFILHSFPMQFKKSKIKYEDNKCQKAKFTHYITKLYILFDLH